MVGDHWAMEASSSVFRPRSAVPHPLFPGSSLVSGAVCLAIVSCLVSACQKDAAPAIKFTEVPRAGEGGPDQTETIAGRVIHARPGQRIVLFAHWGPWWVQPTIAEPFTTIEADSSWRNSTHFGMQYAAVLVDETYHPPATTDVLPSTGPGVIAVAVVKGRPPFWQTWWFLLAAILTSGAVVAVYFLQRILLLAEEDRRFREAIETMPALAFVAHADGDWTFANKGWILFTGLSIERTAGSGWQTAVHPDDCGRVLDKWEASLVSADPVELEMRVRHAGDGAYRWFFMRAVPLRDKRGRVLKWCGAAIDIDDRHRAAQLQSTLAHINRVNTMGEMVASISHELAQPIMASTVNAKASLRWLQRQPPDLIKVREGTERIIEAGTIATQIIERLRSLYRMAPPNRKSVAMNEIIAEMATMLGNEARRHGVSIRTNLGGELPMTVADRVELQQVLMNLMLNGIEGMSETGGILTVRSQPGAQDEILISVADMGCGLPQGKADRLFEAFFTTKPGGSGMGLSISKSIVEARGGHIWATSNEGRGATFYFTLPSAASSKTAQ